MFTAREAPPAPVWKEKPVLEIRRLSNQLSAVLRHHLLSNVLGHPDDVADDFGGIANGVHHADIIHIHHGDAGGHIGEGHQTSVITTTLSAYWASTME